MNGNGGDNVVTRSSGIYSLRANCFGLVVMLCIEFGLGISVNLYSKIPATDHAKGFGAAFASAVWDGPVMLAIHALVGTLIVIGGIAALVRALRIGQLWLTALAGFALLALVVAWISGSRYVGNTESGLSLSMALATAFAIVCYVAIVFISSGRRGVTASHRREK